MALEVVKTEKQSSRSLVRDFSKRVRKSGILVRAKKNQHVIKNKSKQLRKRKALRKLEKVELFTKMKKLGIQK